MANATDLVKRGVVRRTDEFVFRSSDTLVAATNFYPMAMVGAPATGYVAKFDDTQLMTFLGVMANDHGVMVRGPGTAATPPADGMELRFQQPQKFLLAVSGVAVTDIRRRVYALDDQTGTLDPSATTYANLIGVITEYVASGYCMVEPEYRAPWGTALQIAAASGAIQLRPGVVLITKGSAAALTLADPTSGVHDGMEINVFSKTAFAHTITGASSFNLGAGTTALFGAAVANGVNLLAYGGRWLSRGVTGVTFS